MDKVRIVHEGLGPARLTRVYINDEPVNNVTRIEIDSDAIDSDILKVKLTFVNVDLDITGELAA